MTRASAVRGTAREEFDVAAYRQLVREGPCFVCAIAADTAGYRAVHHMIYEDESCLVFLNRFPTLYGATLVCPRDHREDLTRDFSESEYLALQSVIYYVARAIRRTVPCERVYVLSLGSQQGNCHVHWHIAPLPPSVPPAHQQLVALDCHRGVLRISHREQAELAGDIRRHLEIRAPRP